MGSGASAARGVSKVCMNQVIRPTPARGKLCTPLPPYGNHSLLLVENLVDKAVVIQRVVRYTPSEYITTAPIGTKRHASSKKLHPHSLFHHVSFSLLLVTVVVFMHLNRRRRYRRGYRLERETRVKTQLAAEAVEGLIKAY